jgi:hypothetical protein
MWGRFFAAALLLLATACTRQFVERSRPDLPSLIGKGEAAVVAELGTPDRRFDTANLRYLVYERVDIWRTPPHRLAVEFPCRITFILEAGAVRSFDQQGAGCE